MQHLKKLLSSAILALAILFISSNAAQAQSSINLPDEFELGIRIGDTFGSDLAIDAMTPFLGETLHANVGFEDGLSLSAIYNFPNTIVDNLFWYYGFGAQVGFFDDFTLAAAGEIGIEYSIQEFPITFGIDYRPAIDLISDSDFRGNQYGINIRYRF